MGLGEYKNSPFKKKSKVCTNINENSILVEEQANSKCSVEVALGHGPTCHTITQKQLFHKILCNIRHGTPEDIAK